MSKKYTITLTIEAEDSTDAMHHMVIAKEQIKTAIKAAPGNPQRRQTYEGVGSNHELLIEVEEKEED